jgi:exonuclease SbcC
MTLFTDTETLSTLASALSDGLPDAVLSYVNVRDDLAPLLIVEAAHLVAAFALGDDEEAYTALYPAFKKHFMSRGADWSTKDVSFVYCLGPSNKPSEEFCSRVEVDVYFCRKYVVQLKEHIAESLVRLPFLPLEPVTGASLRPPSAQTLLQAIGIKADLARNLVVPGRSASSILADCLGGKFGEPSLDTHGRAAAAPAASTDQSKAQTILKSLSIENFRAYRTKRDFELGSAVTILYGPNGFGKTSFFDALDFAATGGIGKFNRAGTPVAKAARHLDSQEGDKTSVTLTFVTDGETHSLTRDLSDVNKATLNGRRGVERKEVLNCLTGGATAPADRVDNLVALFRATHLFSQESQELTSNFAGSCELSGDLVSRMLAFEDYVSGAKKATEVREAVRLHMAQTASHAAKLRAQAAADAAELARISNMASSAFDVVGVESSIAELNTGLQALGLDGPVTASVAELRGTRLQLEERLGSLNAARLRLTSCMNTIASRAAAVVEASQAAQQSIEATAATDRLLIDNATALAAVQEAAGKAASLAADVTSAQSRVQMFEWAANSKPLFDKHAEQLRILDAQYIDASKAALAAATAASTATESEAAAAAAHHLASTNAAASTASVENLSQLVLRTEELCTVEAQIKEYRAAIVSHEAAIREHEQSAQVLRLADEDVQERIVRIERMVAQVQSQESALKALVSQLRTHVTDGTCLLCAHDHGSKEVLLHAIDLNAPQNSALPELSDQLLKCRQKKLETEAQLADVANKLRAVKSEQETAVRERSRLDAVVASFAQAASGIGIQFSGLDVIATVETKIRQLLTEQLERQQQFLLDARNSASRLQEIRTSQTAEIAKRDEATALVKQLESALATSRSATQALSAEARARQVELASTMADLDALLVSERQRHRESSAAAQAAQTIVEQTTRAQKEADARLAAARGAVRQAIARKSAADERLKALGRSLVEAGFRDDVEELELTSELNQTASQFGNTSSLRDKAQVLEVALDAVATAAAMQSIASRIAECEAMAVEADADVAKHAPWGEYFRGLADLLRERQRSATRHFTDEYGPRTAVIQRRLRPVYGFGEIEVSSRGENIAVHVTRNGQPHRPSDFFSQSQVQTLLLGLFLTASSSQTWSGFSSVMMDDPVTHFDDLNTYALLDLLSGLLSSKDGSRQFVISTCDEKMLQLARQKFRHLGSGAKFYRFSAIGADGPMVSEIPNVVAS